MVQCITQQLRTNICSELNDAALYRELAKIAPRDDVIPLLEIANDEQQQAEDFQCIYQTLTGCSFDPIVDTPILTEPYDDILRNRVLAESEDFRAYGEQSLACRQNPQLQNALACASLDENVHALSLLTLLTKPEPALFNNKVEAAQLNIAEAAQINQVEAAQLSKAEAALLNQANPALLNQVSPALLNQVSPAQLNQANPALLNQVSPAQLIQAKPALINQAEAAQINQAKAALLGQAKPILK